jgi:hypothetical protein
MSQKKKSDNERDSGNGGNGKSAERRTGVDRRISDSPDYTGPERRKGARRRPDRLPDRPLKR